MKTPRRRVLRPPPAAAPTDPRREKRFQKRRAQLEKERQALARWMVRLKRAFRAVEKTQVRIGRLERDVARLEQT
jgi:hypothetical protein